MKTVFVVATLILGLLSGSAHAANVDLSLLTAAAGSTSLPINITGSWADYNTTVPVTQIDTTYSGTLGAYTGVRFDFTVTSGTLSYNSKTLSVNNTNYNGIAPDGYYYNGGTQATWTSSDPYATGSAYFTGLSWGGKQKPNVGYFTLAALLSDIVVDSAQHAYIVITNNSPVLAQFYARIQTAIAYFLASGYNVTYTVFSTTTPLPAALPLFGLGIAGLACARRRKMKKSA